MGKDFEDILEECIARIRSGETNIESCLKEYPRDAERLLPLLETAMFLYQEPKPEPRPEAVSQGEVLLLNKVIEKRLSNTPKRKIGRGCLTSGLALTVYEDSRGAALYDLSDLLLLVGREQQQQADAGALLSLVIDPTGSIYERGLGKFADTLSLLLSYSRLMIFQFYYSRNLPILMMHTPTLNWNTN